MKLMKWIFVVVMLLVQAATFAQDDTVIAPLVQDTRVDEPASDVSSDASSDEASNDIPEPITFRAVPDSIVANLKRDKDFAYANDPDFWKTERERMDSIVTEAEPTWFDKLISQTWFRRVMMALMVCLLVFAVVKIALNNRLVMRRRAKQFDTAEDDEALQKENVDKLIQQAENDANFRLALRYRYIKALQQMEARGLIQLDAKSTNWDYVNRMANHPLKKQFLLLTRAYEYVWYGEFALNGEQYQYLKTEFGQYNNSLA